jgi:hypothetical protein
MATDKTPDYKRIKRAEEGREDWKSKALSRREENEKLKAELEKTLDRLSRLSDHNTQLKKELNEASKRIVKLEQEFAVFKKKASR